MKCTECGLCKTNCPTFRILLDEVNSPRGRAILINDEKYTKTLNLCTLCGSCTVECPIRTDLKSEIEKARETSAKRRAAGQASWESRGSKSRATTC